jgi:hypothetical protein
MTKPLPFTQQSIRRRIAAVLASGLRVKGVANDGTVLVDHGDKSGAEVAAAPESAPSKWRDAET